MRVQKVVDRLLEASGLDPKGKGGEASWGGGARKEGVDWKVYVVKDDSTRNA
jgi:hypothetical protein